MLAFWGAGEGEIVLGDTVAMILQVYRANTSGGTEEEALQEDSDCNV
jgi:hypothetical protein